MPLLSTTLAAVLPSATGVPGGVNSQAASTISTISTPRDASEVTMLEAAVAEAAAAEAAAAEAAAAETAAIGAGADVRAGAATGGGATGGGAAGLSSSSREMGPCWEEPGAMPAAGRAAAADGGGDGRGALTAAGGSGDGRAPRDVRGGGGGGIIRVGRASGGGRVSSGGLGLVQTWPLRTWPHRLQCCSLRDGGVVAIEPAAAAAGRSAPALAPAGGTAAPALALAGGTSVGGTAATAGAKGAAPTDWASRRSRVAPVFTLV